MCRSSVSLTWNYGRFIVYYLLYWYYVMNDILLYFIIYSVFICLTSHHFFWFCHVIFFYISFKTLFFNLWIFLFGFLLCFVLFLVVLKINKYLCFDWFLPSSDSFCVNKVWSAFSSASCSLAVSQQPPLDFPSGAERCSRCLEVARLHPPPVNSILPNSVCSSSSPTIQITSQQQETSPADQQLRRSFHKPEGLKS